MVPWYKIRGERSREEHRDSSWLVFVVVFNAVWEVMARIGQWALCVVVCVGVVMLL